VPGALLVPTRVCGWRTCTVRWLKPVEGAQDGPIDQVGQEHRQGCAPAVVAQDDVAIWPLVAAASSPQAPPMRRTLEPGTCDLSERWDNMGRLFGIGTRQVFAFPGSARLNTMPWAAWASLVGATASSLRRTSLAYVVVAWLWRIILNLLTIPGYFDVALRDFGLSVGAFSLARRRMPTSSRSGRCTSATPLLASLQPCLCRARSPAVAWWPATDQNRAARVGSLLVTARTMLVEAVGVILAGALAEENSAARPNRLTSVGSSAALAILDMEPRRSSTLVRQ
jgi:hypothetical protein